MMLGRTAVRHGMGALGVLLLLWGTALGAEEGFDAWLAAFRTEAAGAGISEATLDGAFAGVAPIARVVELDRSQPELTWTLEQYLERIVSKERVTRGREKLAENRVLLERISSRYGVQPRFLVALWGIETDYGRLGGGFPVVAAIATLAYDGRRSGYFRQELLQALRILEEGHVTPDRMTGSWAGAMGQVQFMPSSFRNFAADGDGDGRIDIWGSREDALTSAANYLARSGWVLDRTWGREVRLPDGLDAAGLGLEMRRPLEEWGDLGIRRIDGRPLPSVVGLPASVIQPDGAGTRAFLVYDNYRVILKWNRSHYFGIAVGTLADRIGG